MSSGFRLLRVKLELKGINEVMKCDGVQRALQAQGERIARRAGSDYAARTHEARWIAVTNIYPNSKRAARENAQDNTLAKALYGTGGGSV